MHILGNNLLPTVLEKSIETNHIELQITIPSDLSYFEGHFSDMPILPGVVQLHWAIHYAKKLLGVQGVILSVSQLKFSHPIQPDHILTLSIDVIPENKGFSFRYYHNDKIYSSGRFIIGGTKS